MTQWFFLSYARADKVDPDLEQFYLDLSREVGLNAELDQDEGAGFFDTKSIELGAEWEPDIIEALCTSRVLVAMCSRHYLASPYCGKEYSVFRQRQDEYKALRGEAVLPAVIFPIVWIPPVPPRPWPAEVLRFQNFHDDLPASYHANGLRQLMRQDQHKADYKTFVSVFARTIMLAGAKYRMKRFAGAQPMDRTPSAFARAAGIGQPLPAADLRGPNSARFVYAAGKAADFAAGRWPEPYAEGGGSRWRPYSPSFTRPLGPVAQEMAAAIDLSSDELPFNSDLLKMLEKAEADREIVVLFIDPWTALIPQYQDVLAPLDGRLFDNCTILVPWNEADPDLKTYPGDLKTDFSSLFRKKSGLRHPIHAIQLVGSPRDLQKRLKKLLRTLKLNLFSATSPAKKAEGQLYRDQAAQQGVDLTSDGVSLKPLTPAGGADV